MKILLSIMFLTGALAAQCSQASNGTNCNSPMSVSGSTGAQSSVGLTDNGAAPPAPAPSQYWLSISKGTIRISANGQPYALPGMPTNYVLVAQAIAAYQMSLAPGTTGYSSAFNQIDMTLPQQVRLIISSSLAAPGCSVWAQYYNGTAWINLTSAITVTNSKLYASAWTALPSGANADRQVRLAISNSGTLTTTVGLRSAMLQFK